MSTLILPVFKGLPHWGGVTVEAEPGLHLLREDLCVTRNFWDDNAPSSIADLVQRFEAAEHFYYPLGFSVRSIVLAASFEWIATWPFRRQVGPGKFARMADLEGAYPWDVEANDTIFQLHIDREYRRLLSVGGASPDEAADNWRHVASSLRKLSREINLDQATPPQQT